MTMSEHAIARRIEQEAARKVEEARKVKALLASVEGREAG